MKKPDYKKKSQSDKIEVNRYKMYRVTDPVLFAHIFYPAKNASHRRAAFLAIYFELKNAKDQKLPSLDHVADKYNLSSSTVIKARTKMARLGLIMKHINGWQFSSVFKNTLNKLIELTETFRTPVEQESQLHGEAMFIEIAKGENKKKEPDSKFTFGSDHEWIGK